ncbi:MAG TPA: LacI family DNA-binding transcriptional regulator [Chthoniobacteraceae bacterium]|nr:LacI family DNA-binding transcriptional regulator [Chthoniobacteraceae bacterium]
MSTRSPISPKPRRITRKEVARLAGVSTTTVTHVLQGNPKTGVSPATREKILRIVADTGYSPHVIASALDQRSLKHLALVLGPSETLDAERISLLLAACREATQKAGYYFMTHEVGQRNVADAGRQALELFRSGRADGLLVYKPDFLNVGAEFLHRHQVPMVMVESIQPVELKDLACVTTDHVLGGRLAAGHLLSLGHRKIGVLTSKLESFEADKRPWPVEAHLDGVREQFARQGMAPENFRVVEGDIHDREKTFEALASLESFRPTALLAGDDLLAVLALTYFQRRGVRVPGELSIIGYGDAPFVKFTDPALTTVRVPTGEVGTLAVNLLLDLIAGQPTTRFRHRFEPTLVIRESTAKVQ